MAEILKKPTFGSRLKELREEKGYTQAALAKEIGCSVNTISVWERDLRKPDFSVLEELSALFNVKLAYLLGESNDHTPPMEPSDSDLDAWQTQEEAEYIARSYQHLSAEKQRFIYEMVKLAVRMEEEETGEEKGIITG